MELGYFEKDALIEKLAKKFYAIQGYVFQIKPIGGKPTDFWLEHGSLLVMHPGCQSTHLHQVPKTNKFVTTRINLTFRPHIGGKK